MMRAIRTARIESATPKKGVTVADLREFVDHLPPTIDDREVIALMGDRGSQRDPDPFLNGLTVTWEEAP